ncbi:MAG: helix-turn-helix domain-containing protein [Oscillospiraceae bacterium]|nr:helix-turn-helix domain-containing protein [Oscillospiraceae bacterium]
MKYELGNRIRKYREQRGLSQKEFASMIGVSNSRVSNWEQGLNRPDADLVADICRVLDVSPSLLLDVRLSTDELNDREKELIRAYRTRTDLQKAVHLLFGLDDRKK